MAHETWEIAGAGRLDQYFKHRLGARLKDRRKRESFAMYAFGILGDGERKSTEPIAARTCADPRPGAQPAPQAHSLCGVQRLG
jgi:hypothetical protein